MLVIPGSAKARSRASSTRYGEPGIQTLAQDLLLDSGFARFASAPE
jgi:hypothetical protein